MITLLNQFSLKLLLGLTVGALPIIEQALIGRRQLRERVTSEGAFYDICAPVGITQPNQDRL